ncbi:hypothetical protein DDD63_09315 [Actinobaculum sp. 313]|nr:hypothetical protein DDD63_09315 [Actinobaculum sp. 313]
MLEKRREQILACRYEQLLRPFVMGMWVRVRAVFRVGFFTPAAFVRHERGKTPSPRRISAV